MSQKKPNIQYVGKTPCEIRGVNAEKVMPNQSLCLPKDIVNNLVLDKNWERIDETPPETKKEKKGKGGK